MTEDNLPLTEPLGADLILAYSVDIGDSFVFVTPAMMRERGLGPEDVQAQAFENLGAALPTMNVASLGPAFRLDLENDLSACTILFPGIWEDFKRQLGASPVAIFAHRNLVFFTSASHADGIRFLRAAVEQVDFNDTHALSRNLYVWDGGWDVYAGAGGES